MPQLIVMVLNEPSKLEPVMDAWLVTGISGLTVLNSQGLAHHIKPTEIRDDLPILVSLKSLLRTREEAHRTLLAVVTDDFDCVDLVKKTETIIGPFNQPNTGILFIIPLGQVWGLNHSPT